jgi:hypothetical protein
MRQINNLANIRRLSDSVLIELFCRLGFILMFLIRFAFEIINSKSAN